MPLWIIISYSIITALCIFSVIKLFARGDIPYAKEALSTYIFYTIFFVAIWIFQIEIPTYILLLTMLTILFACFLGHYLGGYTKSRTFDRYLHAFGSFSFALVTYCTLDNFISTGSSILFQAIFIFCAGNTLGVFFELIEMCHDVSKKDEPKTQKGLRDTDMDMLCNLIGSTLAAVFSFFWLLQ
ncbi:hypothetical protein DSECCO2_196660 [anaerobic digester metagenome]